MAEENYLYFLKSKMKNKNIYAVGKKSQKNIYLQPEYLINYLLVGFMWLEPRLIFDNSTYYHSL